MKVADLHPTFAYVLDSPPPGIHEYAMDCPLCGLRLSFKAYWQRGPQYGYHGMTAAMAGLALDWNTLTVQPSIRFAPYSAHGKKSGCAPHFNITSGEVQIA